MILIDLNFQIPFAPPLAVLFYGIQSNAFYTKFVAILFVVATVLEIGSLFLIYKWSYGEPLIRSDHCWADPDGLYVFDAHPSAGTGLFRCRHCRHLRANLPRHARLSGSGRALRWRIVVGLYPTLLMTLIGVLVVSQSCHYANASSA